MIGNAFGAWLLIFVAGTAFAALAVAIPLAVVSILTRIERVGSWALEQIRHDARGRTSASLASGRMKDCPAATNSLSSERHKTRHDGGA